jgi:flagellar basal-body rod protein FlgF
MLDALTMTEAGMLNDVARLQSIGHNLANVGTVGFKKEVAVTRSFADYLDTSNGAAPPALTTQIDHSDGTLKLSGNPLDVGIEGPGYFVIATPLGEAYTRQGNFHLDANGRLVTASGQAVMGMSGEIQLTTPQPRIDTQGYVWEDKTQVGQLKLVSLENPNTLAPMGDGMYTASDAAAPSDNTVRVRQGFTEAANVVTMNEMIKMIETVRHFETSQKLIRGVDAMLDRAINSGGEVT